MSLGSGLPLEISVEQTQQVLADDDALVLLDCREQDEYNTAKIEAATLIPMSEIQQRIVEVRAMADKRIVVHCHHGGRSLQVAQWLLSQGFQRVQNMTGGIDAWSQRIDPNVPRY
ncbi:MAG: rhodanese-like domain-containing protein [Pirellulaceae bacterium]|jgi:rhodanese-related sulfurtransferase